MDAEDVLPGLDDVAGDADASGSAELAGDRVDDAQVRLVRDERGQLARRDARPAAGLAARPGPSRSVAQRKTAWPSWPRNAGSVDGIAIRVARCSPSLPQTDRADAARRVGRADDGGAGAVGEDDRGAAVVRVDPVGQLLGRR